MDGVVVCFLSGPDIPEGPQYEKISTLYRCTGRSFTNPTWHNDSWELFDLVTFYPCLCLTPNQQLRPNGDDVMA